MFIQDSIMITVLLLCAAINAIVADRPWIIRPGSDHQYQFNDGENSWLFARERCRAQNADLVSINDDEEQNWLSSFYPVVVDGVTTKERYIIIGLMRDTPNGLWKWVDGAEPHSLNRAKREAAEPEHSESLDSPNDSDFQSSPLERCIIWQVISDSYEPKNCDLPLPAIVNQIRYICERTAEQAQQLYSPMAADVSSKRSPGATLVGVVDAAVPDNPQKRQRKVVLPKALRDRIEARLNAAASGIGRGVARKHRDSKGSGRVDRFIEKAANRLGLFGIDTADIRALRIGPNPGRLREAGKGRGPQTPLNNEAASSIGLPNN